MVQTTSDVTDDDVLAISSILDEDCVFQDKREQRTTSLYLAFMLFVYGFLAIITLVTVLNIMNSISMSVPVGSLMFIILFVAVAAILAVYAPAKRIRNTSVTETINEL